MRLLALLITSTIGLEHLPDVRSVAEQIAFSLWQDDGTIRYNKGNVRLLRQRILAQYKSSS